MKKMPLLLFSLFAFLTISAGEVTQAEALQKAQQFFDKAAVGKRAPRQSPALVLANSRDEFYVFNDEANGGYVVVSGEDRMPDVLAYSYNSHFDTDNLPCNMQVWLEGYAGQVKYLRAHPEVKAARRTASARENVGPLLTCWFDQRRPYNEKCPEVEGNRCVTGCVATAMAQIMYYWQWPKQTSKVIPSYTTLTLKIDMPVQPVTTIDWDNILGLYRGFGYTEAQADAISTLMLLCGTAAEMDYSPTGSGAGMVDAKRAFHKYFGYSGLAEYVRREAYSSEDWEQLIYDEMKNLRPVLYTGAPAEDTDGHAFVLDGYEDGYFHVNWGWGGSEGYVLMTSAEGWRGYAEAQDAVVNIQPPSADTPIQSVKADNSFDYVYSLSGVRLRNSAKDLNGMKRGMYIVNGKKVVKSN